jgi:hypothetical protein
MSQRVRTALRFLVLAVTGYLSLATIPGQDWFVESAFVDLPLHAEASTARLRVTVDAEAVIIVAPAALAIQSSSGQVWTPDDAAPEPGAHCGSYRRLGMFCEGVPGGSHAFDYELLLPAGPAGATTRIEAQAGGIASRVTTDGGRLGVNIEVLP